MRMRSPGKEAGIPVALSLCSLRDRMDNPLPAVRDITHKYIVVEGKNNEEKRGVIVLVLTAIITVFCAILQLSAWVRQEPERQKY